MRNIPASDDSDNSTNLEYLMHYDIEYWDDSESKGYAGTDCLEKEIVNCRRNRRNSCD